MENEPELAKPTSREMQGDVWQDTHCSDHSRMAEPEEPEGPTNQQVR